MSILVEALVFLLALGWMAVSATACEGVGGPELTTLSTSLSGEGKEGAAITVLEGSKVKDKATLKGKNASTAKGKVTYKVYSDSECKTLSKEAGEATVSGESVPASSEVELEGGAPYYWQAHYSGDSKNAESTSECDEISTVKAKTSLSTKLSGESKEGEELTVLEGSKVKDKATLTGTKSSSASGKVVYKIYSDNECKTLFKEAGEVTVSSGSVPTSSEVELEGGKTYYWQATYKGDSLHEESKSNCGSEVLKVKAKTMLATVLSGGGEEGSEITVPEDTKVKDRATVEGTNSATAEGKVLYKVYSDKECKDLVKEAGEVSVSGGSAPSSTEVELSGGASYYWQATYKGDSLHEESNSECDKEIANVQAPTTLSTALSGEAQTAPVISVAGDASVSDAATLSGAVASLATGTVKYNVYSDYECKDLVAKAGEATVSGEVVPASSGETLPVGTYYWQASYSGNKLNESSTSACDSEVEIVTPEITTSLSAEGQDGAQLEILEGAGVKDTATLHGENASSATGTVKYDVYSDNECKDLVTHAGEATVSGASVPASSEETLSPGTYYWQASYSGDAHNPAVKSECGIEAVVVTTSITLSTSLAGESKTGADIEVKEGSAVHDTTTLSGTHAATAGGHIEYNVYSDSECKDLVAQAGSGEVTSGSVPASSEETLPVGTYYWQAVYSGEGVNHSTIGACGAEISVVTTPITTSLSGDGHAGSEIEIEEGEPVTDTATLHGEHASIATGTVKYAVYSDGKCEHLVTNAGEVSVSGASVPASDGETLSPGIYYWQASYSGDSNNAPAKSACSTAVVVVSSTLAQYAALGDSFSSGEGTAPYYANTNVLLVNQCHRSPVAYPVRLAQARFPDLRLTIGEENEVFAPEPKFIFRACNAAITTNVWNVGEYNEWIGGGVNHWITLPTQVTWLHVGEPPTEPNERITLVTLTIGGNDAGFGTIARNCISSPPLNNTLRYTREKCKEVIDEWETGEAGTPNTLERGLGIPSLIISIPRTLRAIHEAAPNARIMVPLYPRILNTGVYPRIMLNANFEAFIENPIWWEASVAVALEKFQRTLNETIATSVKDWAETNGVDAEVVPNTVDAFKGHRLGDGEPWVNGLVLGGFPPFRESLHPTCRGQLALARAMLGPLGFEEPEGWTC
jgi:predicted  nucleic acid-binding Zn ribbon protein